MPVAYDIGCYLNPAPTRKQAVGNADRPVAALVSALSVYMLDLPLHGTLRGASDDEVEEYFTEQFAEYEVDIDRALWWARCVAHPSGHTLPLENIPREVNSLTLSDYQIEAAARFTQTGFVADLGCGLGKTLISAAYAIAWARTYPDKAQVCDIVCPLNVGAWEAYRQVLGEHFRYVQVLSIDSAHKYSHGRQNGGLLIFDESHLLGHDTARRTQNCHLFRRGHDACLCLTGTLLHAGLEVALNNLDLATPGAALFGNKYSCGEHFRCLSHTKFGTSLEHPCGDYEEMFHAFLHRYSIAMNEENENVKEQAGIPDQTLHTIRVAEPHPTIEQSIADWVLEYLREHEDDEDFEFPHMAKAAHGVCRAGVEEKIEWLSDFIAEQDDSEQFVMFANYRATLDALESAVALGGEPYCRVDGEGAFVCTPAFDNSYNRISVERADLVKRFLRGDIKYFLGQATAACVSIDLYTARYSFSLDLSWKAPDYDQLLHRTKRRGQTRECHHYDLVANKLQDMVVNRLRRAMDFNSRTAEYQAAKAQFDLVRDDYKEDI